MSDTSAGRLEEIRAKPFGELTPDEKLDYIGLNAREYLDRASAWRLAEAREAFEREHEDLDRRAREQAAHPVRRLWQLLGGRSRRSAVATQLEEQADD